jgi:hypothetical protein
MPMSTKSKFSHLPLSTSGPVECAVTGTTLLNTPYFNKGSAFPPGERRAFKLTGLLPQGVQGLRQQVQRAYQQYSTREDDLAKNTFLASLMAQNEVLFFRVGTSHIRILCLLVSLCGNMLKEMAALAGKFRRDVQYRVHPHRGRRDSKLLSPFQTPRGLLLEHQRSG